MNAKKIIATAFSIALSITAITAQSDWSRVFSGGLSVPVSHQTYKFDDERDSMNLVGGGTFIQYAQIHKETGFSFVLNENVNAFGTKEFDDDWDAGFFYSTFAGLGFSPVKTERSTLLFAAGLGAEIWTTDIKEDDDYTFSKSGVNFCLGADISYAYRITDRIGLNFNLLGLFDVAGESIESTTHTDCDDHHHRHDHHKKHGDHKEHETETWFNRAGGWTLLPSVGVSVHL